MYSPLLRGRGLVQVDRGGLRKVRFDWMDDLPGEDPLFADDDVIGTFYCPYTNGAECALLVKGWQPQELCHTLECDQLKLFQRPRRRRRRAA